jgi:hypothetical protein
MTTGDIQAHLAEIYGTDISRDTISRITDAVVEDMVAWQNRPLDTGSSPMRSATLATTSATGRCGGSAATTAGGRASASPAAARGVRRGHRPMTISSAGTSPPRARTGCVGGHRQAQAQAAEQGYDTPLEDGEAGMTGERRSLTADAPPDNAPPGDPYREAQAVYDRVLAEGGMEKHAIGAAFNSVVNAAHRGDQRVIIRDKSGIPDRRG